MPFPKMDKMDGMKAAFPFPFKKKGKGKAKGKKGNPFGATDQADALRRGKK